MSKETDDVARSSRSSSGAHARNGTVDHVNEDWTHHNFTIKIGRSRLITESTRRGATRGDIPTVRSSSDELNQMENVGSPRGIMPHLVRAIVGVHSIFLRSNGPRFLGGISL